MTKKNIAILGSTGSIGTQALEVIEEQNHLFEVRLLVAGSNADLLIAQARKFQPDMVVIADEDKYDYVKEALSDTYVKVYAGKESINECVQFESIDIVLTAMVGYAGLAPTLHAISAGKHIALANKETLVVAGELVMQAAAEKNVNIIPVDSEHSAIFQCMAGEWHNPIEKIYLTASGGPFRGKSIQDLEKVTVKQALKHPNWEMGAKITIDSATLMNKGLEVIEARWLFKLKPEQVDVIVHPQSIIHSIVQYKDGSMKAQMGLPDMKLPIQYAFTFPARVENTYPRFNFLDYPSLTFEKPDYKTFKNLSLSFDSMKKGGNMPCVLNAANEVAVDAFLKGKIKFLQIAETVENALSEMPFIAKPSILDYIETDKETRIRSTQILEKF
ncbi:MAG: 1-deoxy-D-xylulose-5-phosphate reductoisomerase [Chitinophagaceae bacterium]|nr:MAG: 1-deoxy-D-xylulose-5-phosphate reductoisomerase [Chitinophagaceae bacterium]